ncbi:hypothetical protein [Plebeiibacterium marinum]|uniref:Uncharacterized protein n=1 Tax=Plebeiibacterium marinum TaxID=2992111 RepID=A0AAE3SIQ7_9BACT|nr:hypothetical protein [Plebeiobacterium marinum]MCW3804654.1 hypothetical protein [Plebeiobacterium marinum]
MQQYFNISRFLKYAKYNFVMNQKTYLLSISGLSAGLFLVTLVMSYNKSLAYNNSNWPPFFFICMAIVLLPVIGHSFPFLRKKELSLKHYMLPASVFEKFTFEFILKLIFIPTLFVLIFPLVSNLAVSAADFIYHVNPDNTPRDFISFSYDAVYTVIDKNNGFNKVVALLITTSAFLAFTGSSVFKKYPLIKTVLFLGCLILSVIGYFYILMQKLRLENGIAYTFKSLFSSDTEALNALYIFLIFSALCSISYAYFKLKEREV